MTTTTATAQYQDLLIVDNDLALDAIGVPLGISDRASIAQDIQHLIRDSGLLVDLIGERDSEKVQLQLVRLETLVEEDTRLVPGSVQIRRIDTASFLVQAQTQEYGPLEVRL